MSDMPIFQHARRIVIKIGSAVLDQALATEDYTMFADLIGAMAHYVNLGKELILVTSGAVSTGMRMTDLKEKPHEIVKKQALAAIGQTKLMQLYHEHFWSHRIQTGQVLLTRESFEHRRQSLNLRYTLEELLANRVVPIINENDSVAIEELRYGDNDQLSALTAIHIQAQLIIFLTTVDGVYTQNPAINPQARFLDTIDLTQIKELSALAQGKSTVGSGGMASKLNAAELVAQAGIAAIICQGKDMGTLYRIADGKAAGTFIAAVDTGFSAWEKWLMANSSARGKRIYVDLGAVNALRENGRSLLSSGITTISGTFQKGDVVKVMDAQHRPIAKGIVNYSSFEIERIKGLQSNEIEQVLGYEAYPEVIHRNNMVILPQ